MRRRRVLRWLLWGMGGLVGLVVLVVAGALVVLQTSAGRGFVERQIETALNGVVDGQVDIGALSGNLLGSAVLTDVVVVDRSGREVIRVKRIEAHYDLLPLLGKTVHVTALRVTEPVVAARRDPAGRIDLATLARPPESASTEPSPWRIVVDRAAVEGGRFSLVGGGEPIQVDGIELVGAVRQRAGDLAVTVDTLGARWVDKSLTVSARGTVHQTDDEISVAGVHISAGDSRVAVPHGVFRREGRSLAAATIDVKAADLRRVRPDLPWRGDVSLAGTIDRSRAEEVAADLAGTIAGAPVTIAAVVTPSQPAVRADIHVNGIDPAAMWAGAPPGALRLDGRAEVSGRSLETLRGTAHLEGSGRLRGQRIDRVAADVVADAGVLRATVDGRAPGAVVKVEGALAMSQSPPVVRAARINVRVDDVSRFAGDALPVRGAVIADLSAIGPVDDLAVRGTIRATELRYQDVRVGRADADVDVRGLPSEPIGTAHVTTQDVYRGRTYLGGLRADVTARDWGRRIEAALDAGGKDTPYGFSGRAQIERVPNGPTRIQVDRFRLRTRDLEWNGSGAQVTIGPGGAVSLRDVTLASTAGRVKAAGELRPRGGQLDATIDSVDLEAVRRAIAPDLDPKVTGELNGHVVVVQEGKRLREVRAELSARRLAWREGIDPVSAKLDARLAGRELTGSLSVDGGTSGTIALEVGARAPVDTLDPAAWRRLDDRSVRKARLELRGLRLQRVSELAGIVPPLTGIVDGTIEAGAGLTTLAGNVTARELVTAYVDRPVSLTAKLDLRDRRLTVDARAERDGGGAANATAKLAVPLRLTDIQAWRRVGPEDVEAAGVTLEAVELAWIPPIHDRFPDVQGTISGRVDARARGEERVVADLQLQGVRTPALADALAARVQASLYDDRLTARLSSRLGDRRLVEGDVTVAAGLDALRSGDGERFLVAAGRGEARIDELPLALVQKMMDGKVPMEGVAHARVTLAGSLRQPTVELQASVDDARLGGVSLRKLDASGRLDASRVTGNLTADQDGGGSLKVELEVNRRDARDGRAHILATRFDLGFLAAFRVGITGLPVRKGVLDADLEVGGTFAQPFADGSVKLTGGEIRLTDSLETFHEAEIEARSTKGGEVTVKLRTRAGADGSLELDGKMRLAGLSLRDASADFRAENLSVSAGGTKVEVDARGQVSGKPDGAVYALEVALEEGIVTLPDDTTGSKLHPTDPLEDVVFVDAKGEREQKEKQEEAEGKGKGGTFLRIHLNPKIAILVRSDQIRAELDTDLTVEVTAKESRIRGVVRIGRGYVELFGRRWSFQASEVVFDGRTPPNPRLDLNLSFEFRATTVLVSIAGTARRPRIELSSVSGEYDQAHLLAFVLGGSPDEPASEGDTNISQEALGAASGLLFGQLSPLFRKVLPVDVISLRRRTGLKDEMQLTVGKWITPDVFLSYRYHFGQDAGENDNLYEGSIEWYLFKSWRLDVVFGERGEGSADLLWINRW